MSEQTTLPGEEITDEQVRDESMKGLSGHQKNRRLALQQYGTDPDYTGNDFRLEFADPADRARATDEITAHLAEIGSARKSIGGDRYLSWVKAQGWPEGVMVVVYPDEIEARKAARTAQAEEAKAQRAAEREAAKAEKEAAKAEAKPAKKSKKAKAEDTNFDPAADSEFVEL